MVAAATIAGETTAAMIEEMTVAVMMIVMTGAADPAARRATMTSTMTSPSEVQP